MWCMVCGLGVAVGYHRVFSHKTHQLPTWKENIILFFALFPSAALANRADADVCAKSLSTNSKIIYKAAVDRVVPGEVQQNKEMLRELVEEMINSGKITIDEAYPSAMAAANCLKKMNIGYELIDKKKTP